jgi:protein-tyrosine-phosphatase/N-acetylglutamate synthase-like GNAT family acetyltransferase
VTTPKTYLFACVHNAGRSQMAAAWFNRLADPDDARAVSAGTAPGARVHPEVQAAMLEAGIDLSGATPRLLTDELAGQARLLVTMGCGEACPVVPGLRREDWPLEDPKGKPLDLVRAIRDDIRGRVRALLIREGIAQRLRPPEAVTIARATADDLPAIAGLLARCQLPTADLTSGAPVPQFLLAREGDRLVGCIGLEPYAPLGLVRSLAVDPAHRHVGLGRQLWSQLRAHAAGLGLTHLYLLTTTAEPMFARWGFLRLAREAAPAAIKQTAEYRALCPASAAFMQLAI